MLDFMKVLWCVRWWKRRNHNLTGHLLWLAMGLSVSLQLQAMPESKAIPGGIVTLAIGHQNQPKPSAYFNQKPVAVIKGEGQHSGQWLAIVGLGLSTDAGQHELRVNGKSHPFKVEAKTYPEQHIQLKTRKHIDLSAADLKRHRGEKKQSQAAFKHFDEAQEPDFAFIKPVNGPYSSPFGLKRFFNGEPRNPHSGLDIAAPTGTPIKAPAQGKVVLTGDFFFNGNVVYLDHGQGVVTMYCHMDRIDVKTGDLVDKGQPIGTVGATGRVTGPHLHWSVSLNNSRIDPMLLLEP